jgi:hypothetical protein
MVVPAHDGLAVAWIVVVEQGKIRNSQSWNSGLEPTPDTIRADPKKGKQKRAAHGDRTQQERRDLRVSTTDMHAYLARTRPGYDIIAPRFLRNNTLAPNHDPAPPGS